MSHIQIEDRKVPTDFIFAEFSKMEDIERPMKSIVSERELFKIETSDKNLIEYVSKWHFDLHDFRRTSSEGGLDSNSIFKSLRKDIDLVVEIKSGFLYVEFFLCLPDNIEGNILTFRSDYSKNHILDLSDLKEKGKFTQKVFTAIRDQKIDKLIS